MKITLIVDQRKDPIEVELEEGITLEELAKKSGYSKSRFS